MEIIIKQFRCWDELTLKFQPGKITLLKGVSGSGKSTIFSAIEWCLFGRLKCVNPFHDEKAKTSVTLNLSTISITRMKNPNRLHVILKDSPTIYESEVAQRIINNYFGTEDLWTASSYIVQGTRNSFLISNNASKIELLKSIAFSEEDPTVYITKIDQKISETDSIYKYLLQNFNTMLNAFNGSLATYDPGIMSKILDGTKIAELERSIASLSEEHDKLSQRMIVRKTQEDLYRNLSTQSDNLKQQLKTLDNLENYKIKYTTLTGIVELLKQRDLAQIEIQKYTQLGSLSDDKNYTHDDYSKALNDEYEYNTNKKLAVSCNVKYDQESLSAAKTEYKRILFAQDKLKLLQAITNLETTIDKLKKTLVDIQELNVSEDDLKIKEPPVVLPEKINESLYDPTELQKSLTAIYVNINTLESHQKHLQISLNTHKCPYCAKGIKYNNGDIVKAEIADNIEDNLRINSDKIQMLKNEALELSQKLTTLKSEYQKALNGYNDKVQEANRKYNLEKTAEYERVKKLQDYLSIRKNNEGILKQILENEQTLLQYRASLDKYIHVDSANVKLFNESEIINLNNLIKTIDSIKILPEPLPSSAEIKNCLQISENKVKLSLSTENHQKILEKIPEEYRKSTVSEITQNIKDAHDKITQITALSDKAKYYAEQMEQILKNLPADESVRITEIISNLQSNKETLRLAKIANELSASYNKLNTDREELVRHNARLSALYKLRQHAVDTECDLLQNTIESINAAISSICTNLFDNDIMISLSSYKTFKTTDNVKVAPTFNISYRGGEFDNVNVLSGGEGDRVSLAITLALSRLSDCPFILLDETLASLNADVKYTAVKTIAENTNKIVIVVMHDGVDGIFNDVIDIGDI